MGEEWHHSPCRKGAYGGGSDQRGALEGGEIGEVYHGRGVILLGMNSVRGPGVTR